MDGANDGVNDMGEEDELMLTPEAL